MNTNTQTNPEQALQELQETIDRMYARFPAPQPINRLERLARWMNVHPIPAWIAVSVIASIVGNAVAHGVIAVWNMVTP